MRRAPRWNPPPTNPQAEQTEFLAPGLAAPESKGWIGERYDADAGLQYLNARYYDPVLGMFLQPDWFEVLQPGVGTNRFSYSFNDPVNLSDPMGNVCAPCAIPFVVEGVKWVGVTVLSAVGIYVVSSSDQPPQIGHNSRVLENPTPPPPPNPSPQLDPKVVAAAVGAALQISGGLGKPQQTSQDRSGEMHADLSQALGASILRGAGQNGVGAQVIYNRQLSSVFPGVSSTARPDVIVVLRDGRVVVGEVPSGLQRTGDQQAKADAAVSALREAGISASSRVIDTGRGSAAREVIRTAPSSTTRSGLLQTLKAMLGL
jgi:RHS repeat-associated protein